MTENSIEISVISMLTWQRSSHRACFNRGSRMLYEAVAARKISRQDCRYISQRAAGTRISRNEVDMGSMGRLGQDKPAFGWELEPFWPLRLPIVEQGRDAQLRGCVLRCSESGERIGREFERERSGRGSSLLCESAVRQVHGSHRACLVTGFTT
jgi:hypothetical protein